MLTQPLLDYYRCPQALLDFHIAKICKESSSSVPFDPDVIRYAQPSSDACPTVHDHLCAASQQITCHERTIFLPFDFTQVVDNLRYERYVDRPGRQRWLRKAWIKEVYYLLRPMFPVALRKHLQKLYLRGWNTVPFPRWPVDRSVDVLFERALVLAMHALHTDCLPFIWFWPEGHAACAIVTHDVETTAGRDFTERLMDIDDAFGIKTSYQIVPEKRYAVSAAYLDAIQERGCEICVQGLDHDGNLFRNQAEFLRSAQKINQYAKQFGAQGFRSPVLYRNADWFKYLCFSYDMSVPNVARLDPQPGGCCTVMPYFLPGNVLELPLTTTQDYSLFHILEEYSLALWKQQISIILAGHGLMSFIIHPDYIMQNRAQDVYKTLLAYLARLRSDHGVWMALPRDVDRWWRERSEMELVADGAGWRIEGAGRERARVAYARLDGDRLVYEIDAHRST